jgi:2-succinyl-6-hydroxy-2,4-cyclohexadiene-1-carboxylate synthase
MIIEYKNIKLNLEHLSTFDNQKSTILFLHGFTGKSIDWKDVAELIDERFNKIAIDLAGHGKSSSLADIQYYKIESLIDQIESVLNQLNLKKIILLGYSMGGRVALCFTIEKSEYIKALILESTTAGIKSEKERIERKNSDDELATYLEKNNVETFIDKWLDKEIFGTIRRFSNEKIKIIKQEKMKNTRIGLANSLRGFGTGNMNYLGESLGKLKVPVLLLSGQLDSKFTRLNAGMQKLIATSKHIVVSNAGHNIHLEEQKKFVKAVNKFLKSIE